MDSFYASIEQMDNPDIKGKPVIVVPCLTDYTCAIAASYEAKALGIKTGTRVLDAKKKSIDLIVLEARPMRCHGQPPGGWNSCGGARQPHGLH